MPSLTYSRQNQELTAAPEIRYASFLGITWISGYNDLGIPSASIWSDDDLVTDTSTETTSESSSSTDKPESLSRRIIRLEQERASEFSPPDVSLQLGSNDDVENFDYEPEDFNLDDFIDNGDIDESEPLITSQIDKPDGSAQTGSNVEIASEGISPSDTGDSSVQTGSKKEIKPDDFDFDEYLVHTGSSNDINPESSCRSTIN